MPDDKNFYTPTEIAKELSVSLVTVHRWIEDGLLKSFRVGRVVRVPAESFNEFISRNSDHTTEDKSSNKQRSILTAA